MDSAAEDGFGGANPDLHDVSAGSASGPGTPATAMAEATMTLHIVEKMKFYHDVAPLRHSGKVVSSKPDFLLPALATACYIFFEQGIQRAVARRNQSQTDRQPGAPKLQVRKETRSKPKPRGVKQCLDV
ncbi:MAG: hypothetical protein M3Z31_18695 [Pseudomonadota bacterium]|nr:hypothetical protein [Pseudomonadota bacterium]